MTEEKKTETVTEGKNPNYKVRAIWAIVLMMFFLASYGTITTFFVVKLKDQLDKSTYELTDTKKIADDSLSRINELTNENGELILEYDKLNKRLEGIKDQDDLLRRDIELYIDKKFKLVPKVLCKDIAENVVKFSNELDVSPELVVGIIEVESSFNPMAISNKQARGLMQLMPEWAEKFGLKDVDDFHDVDVNIQHGIKVLKIHIDQDGKGNVTKGLYYYVGKDKTYADLVFKAMGKFVSFRYTVDDSEQNGDENSEEGDPQTVNEPTEPNPSPGGSPTKRPN